MSTSYWPLAWPPPRPARLTVYTPPSRLVLPVRPITPSAELPAPPFGRPEGSAPLSTTQVLPGEYRWRVSRDLVDYTSVLEVVKDTGAVRYDDIDLTVVRRAHERYSWIADDFGSARGESEWTMAFSRAGWSVRTVSRTVLTCTSEDFLVHAQLDGYEGERRVFSRNWHHTIPRYCV